MFIRYNILSIVISVIRYIFISTFYWCIVDMISPVPFSIVFMLLMLCPMLHMYVYIYLYFFSATSIQQHHLVLRQC